MVGTKPEAMKVTHRYDKQETEIVILYKATRRQNLGVLFV